MASLSIPAEVWPRLAALAVPQRDPQRA